MHKELPYRLDIKLTQSDVLKDGSSLFHYTIICPSEAVSPIFEPPHACQDFDLSLDACVALLAASRLMTKIAEVVACF